MRRADRLFQIIQILRRSSRPATAQSLAAELEVSTRTVYRDIADLIAQRTPISGEAGVGYVLARDFDMPPLMLTADEIEAVVLGAQWVAQRADRTLANAARDVVAKIEAVAPEALRPLIASPGVGVRPGVEPPAGTIDTSRVRRAIREGRKLRLRYRAESGQSTERIVWPVILGYAEATGLIVAWCELRGDFRHFRVDRVTEAETLAEPIPLRKGELRRRWQQWRDSQQVRRPLD